MIKRLEDALYMFGPARIISTMDYSTAFGRSVLMLHRQKSARELNAMTYRELEREFEIKDGDVDEAIGRMLARDIETLERDLGFEGPMMFFKMENDIFNIKKQLRALGRKCYSPVYRKSTNLTNAQWEEILEMARDGKAPEKGLANRQRAYLALLTRIMDIKKREGMYRADVEIDRKYFEYLLQALSSKRCDMLDVVVAKIDFYNLFGLFRRRILREQPSAEDFIAGGLLKQKLLLSLEGAEFSDIKKALNRTPYSKVMMDFEHLNNPFLLRRFEMECEEFLMERYRRILDAREPGPAYLYAFINLHYHYYKSVRSIIKLKLAGKGDRVSEAVRLT